MLLVAVVISIEASSIKEIPDPIKPIFSDKKNVGVRIDTNLFNQNIGTNAVRRFNIMPGSIDSIRMANGAVTALQIAPASIGQLHLMPNIQATLAGAKNNAPNTLVKRDNKGNFSAGTITANLVGNVTGNITNPQVIGNINIQGNANLNSGLNISGQATINNHLSLNGGDLIVGSNKTTGGNLRIDGIITTLATYGNSISQTANIVFIDTNGQLGTLVSSQRYKENIISLDKCHDILDKLRPVRFIYKADCTRRKQYGLIAEEVEAVAPELVIYNKDNLPETVAYHHLPPLLLCGYQQQQKRILELEQKIEHMQHQLDAIFLLLGTNN